MDLLHQFLDDLHAWLETCSPEDIIYNDRVCNPPSNATLLPLLQKLVADTSSIASPEYDLLKFVAQMATSQATSTVLLSGLITVLQDTPALAVGTTDKAESYRRAIMWHGEVHRMRDEKELEKKLDKEGVKTHQVPRMDPVEKFYDNLYIWLQDSTRPRNRLGHTSRGPDKRLSQQCWQTSRDSEAHCSEYSEPRSQHFKRQNLVR